MKKGDLVTLKSDLEQKHPMAVIRTFGDLSAEIMITAPEFYVTHRNSVECEWIEPDGSHKKEWYDAVLLVPYSKEDA